MKIKIITTFLLLLINIYGNFKQDSIANLFISKALKDAKGYNILKKFCEFGPRLSGSNNLNKALLWMLNQAKSEGFDTVYLQKVMVPNWKRGDKEICQALLNNDTINLNILALGRSVKTPPKGIIAEVIEIKNFKDLQNKKDLLKNKIAFFSKEFNNGYYDPMKAYGENIIYRLFAADSASKYGALAAITMSITSAKNNSPYTGVMLYSGNFKKIPAVAIGYKDGKRLSNLLNEHPNLKLKLLLNCETKPDTISYNLVMEIKGTEKPEEIILVGGHSDSWDVGCGAHDDASGCIQAYEAIELFKRLNIKPKRTLRCVFFVNEENGFRGATEYYNHFKNDKHIAAIESDRGCGSPRGFYIDSDNATLTKLQKYLLTLNKTGIEWIKKGGSGADIARIKNCNLKIGFVPDYQRYMDYHHSENDTFDKIHPREFELGTAAIATLIYILDNEEF